MQKKFIVPVLTMFLSLIVWILFIIFHAIIRAPRMKTGVCLLSALFMVISAVICKMMEGSRAGSIVRAGLLVVMALITVWVIDLQSARLFLAAAIVPGVLASIATKK
ncbi:MAG: hypothetical protein JW863_04760 [Chitinispirillaceae bacterium]|nr:hypothetical protein [Chitinispirillaceae bacterium]